MSPAPLPLAGVRVVEISSFVAVPLAGMTLAALGAEVVRVDPIGGAADSHSSRTSQNTRKVIALLTSGDGVLYSAQNTKPTTKSSAENL